MWRIKKVKGVLLYRCVLLREEPNVKAVKRA